MAIAVRPTAGISLLPMPPPNTIGANVTYNPNGSRAGTPTGSTCNQMSEIPAITVTSSSSASSSPSPLALVNQQHALKIPRSQVHEQNSINQQQQNQQHQQQQQQQSPKTQQQQQPQPGQQQQQASSPTVNSAVQMCATGRTYCF